jgi:hypothetical protein
MDGTKDAFGSKTFKRLMLTDQLFQSTAGIEKSHCAIVFPGVQPSVNLTFISVFHYFDK